MAHSKRVIVSLLLLQVLFTQAKVVTQMEAKRPCQLADCGEEGMVVVCKGEDIVDLSKELDAVEGIEAATTLLVKNTLLVRIEANITSKAFTTIIISHNNNLESIDPLAFASSISTLTTLRVEHSASLGDTLWPFVSQMSELKNLLLYHLSLKSVPANAFNGLKQLIKISLLSNEITDFAASLAGLNLLELILNNNQLRLSSFANDVFKDACIETLSLKNNPNLTQLDKGIFGGLMANKTILFVGGNQNDAPYLKCVGAGWLCDARVFGYSCAERDDFPNLSTYCDRLSGSKY